MSRSPLTLQRVDIIPQSLRVGRTQNSGLLEVSVSFVEFTSYNFVVNGFFCLFVLVMFLR